jgi:primosomal protein N' (replication factor Y)
MYYYEILPRDKSFFSEKLLTYSSVKKIPRNSVVKILLKKKIILGLVIKTTTKPHFKTNEIIESYPSLDPLTDKSIKLISWIHNYYPGPLGLLLNMFLPAKLLVLDQNIVAKNTIKAEKNTYLDYNLPALTKDQLFVLSQIKSDGSYLLHGNTGTGKTRVYIELAKRALSQNKSALILTPEISLTPQLQREFEKTFGNKVIINHSKLSPSKRLENWLKILNDNESVVCLGPRSSLFMPFKNLGLVVIDESHESSYKQEQAPHYSANRVASKLASLHNAIFIMGSATPSITDYYLAKNKKIPILRMKNNAKNNSERSILKQVVDIKNKALFTRSKILSDTLLEAIETALSNKEQALIFLNRRGTSRIILCEQCGWQLLCKNCDVPLVFHQDDYELKCHICSYAQKPFTNCPDCNSNKIIFKGYGTKTILSEVNKIFPDAKVMRFDKDNSKAESFEQNYYSVKNGDVDILVGTQSIIKGLDLPKLSVVGITIAESSLSFPDYTATEITYQQINQAIGRIGRGHTQGTAVIQSYNPENPIIKDAVNLNYEDFYENELKERKEYNYPPFYQILKLTCLKSSRKIAENFSTKLINQLNSLKLDIIVSGPAPSFHAKIDGKFQYQIIVKSSQRSALLEIIKNLPKGWNFDIDPINLL